MKNTPSLLRLEEHAALERVAFSGMVLDLGGDKNSEYLRCIKGEFETTTLNISERARPDIIHDLEEPLPLPDASFDHVIAFNVLEHIFNYRELLRESLRVLRSDGSMVVVVPFLFPVHPSPQDYRRFTVQALKRELAEAGFISIDIIALGRGVCSARYVLLDRLLPRPVRFFSFYTWRYAVIGLDVLLARLAKASGKRYRPEDYALGYCVIARKPV